MKKVALQSISSTSSTSADARCSMGGATSVRLVSLGGRCIFSAMT